MKKEISPVQAVLIVLVLVILVGGVWWFAKGRQAPQLEPAPASSIPEEVVPGRR